MGARKSSPGAERATVRDRLGEWRRLLDRCGCKPTRKRVHSLRVVTLRLQAELDKQLAELPRASHQAQSILHFGKQAARLRRMLGELRETDVWLGKLRGLRTSMSETAGYVPRSSLDCLRQIERMEERQKAKRRACEKRLLAEIERRRGQIELAGEDVHGAVEVGHGEIDPGSFELILGRFAAVAADFPTLDEKNLHEFRKRIKTVRYLAEMSAGDPACSRVAAQMKRLQVAIGKWHDWQALAREVSRGQRDKNRALADLLDALTSEAFDAAIATCHSITSRLLAGKGTSNADALASARKPPARSVQHPIVDAHQRTA